MRDANLLPEQEQLVCRLVSARNRLLPKREQFHFKRDWSGPDDCVMMIHGGWPSDAPPVMLADLRALEAENYINVRHFTDGGEFELTGKAVAHHESLERRGSADTETEADSAGASHSVTLDRGEGVPGRLVFRKKAKVWEVSYQGEIGYIDDGQPIRYLLVLIANAGKAYEPAELNEAVDGSPLKAAGSGVATSRRSLQESGLSVSGYSDAGDVADGPAVTNVRNRVDEIDEELVEAREWNDQGRIDQLTLEREQCLDYLKKAVGPKGRLRKADSDYIRAKDRAYTNIYRALKAIRVAHPRLYEDLKPMISKSPPYSCCPNPRDDEPT